MRAPNLDGDPVLLANTKMVIHARAGQDHQMYEGEALMSKDQQDRYKGIVGDGLSKVTIGRDIGEKDFGSGGGVMVSVTLTCDQSQQGINTAIHLAHEIADQAAWHYQEQLKARLLQSGILQQR